MIRPKVILIIFGRGGHRAQMQNLLNKIIGETNKDEIEFISIAENNNAIKDIVNFSSIPLRDKFSITKTIAHLLASVFLYPILLIRLITNYEVLGVVSTGPGIAIIPSLFFKFFRKNIVYIETWSRFNTQSQSGKIMYKIADKFYIQNMEQYQFYPNAIYGGLL